MQTIILSYRRPSNAVHSTWNTLRKAEVPVTMVVREEEKKEYSKWVPSENLWVLPVPVDGVAATRDSILYDMNSDDTVCMLDDDLEFAVRRSDDRQKFRPAEPEDIRNMLSAISNKLAHYPHVSIGPREGGNRNTDSFMFNVRVMRVLAYDRCVMRHHQITFKPAEFMADFHVALTLLRLGYDYCVINDYVSNQRGGSGAPGGCSGLRTAAAQTAEAHRLSQLHPGFVKVLQKATKTAWGGGVRTDVTVQWKAARRSAG